MSLFFFFFFFLLSWNSSSSYSRVSHGLVTSITKSWSVVFIVTMLLLCHISSHIINLFYIFSFLYLNFSSPYFQKKKTKKLFFSLLIHTPTVTLLLTFIFPFYLFISLLFYHYTSFIFLYFDSCQGFFLCFLYLRHAFWCY